MSKGPITPPKTNMTMEISNHLKMYLLLKIWCFSIAILVFRGVTIDKWEILTNLVSICETLRKSSNNITSQISLTLPKTNIARKNRPSQKESSLPTIHFQGLLLLVSGSVFSPENYQYPLKNAGTERRSFPFEILPFRWHLFIFETWGASGSGSETATRLPEKIHGYGWPLSSPER